MSKEKTLVLAIVVLLLATYFFFGPIVVDLTDQKRMGCRYQKGDTIRPLEQFKFDKGDWKAYLVISNEDHFSFSINGGVFVTENTLLLEELKKNWIFVYTGADVATIQSKFLLYKEGSLVFVSNIMLDKHQSGLQNVNYGWLKTLDDEEFWIVFKRFEKGYFPLYYFNN